MTLRMLFCVACLTLGPATTARAQPPAPATAPGQLPRSPAPTNPPPAAAAVPGQSINVKVDVTITDQRAGGAQVKKTVSVVVADNKGSRIRSQGFYTGAGEVPLNVDAEPTILSDGKIRLAVNLQYDLPGGIETLETPMPKGSLSKMQLQENFWLILENGKPLVAAQSADPVGDRQVTIEVKATILR